MWSEDGKRSLCYLTRLCTNNMRTVYWFINIWDIEYISCTVISENDQIKLQVCTQASCKTAWSDFWLLERFSYVTSCKNDKLFQNERSIDTKYCFGYVEKSQMKPYSYLYELCFNNKKKPNELLTWLWLNVWWCYFEVPACFFVSTVLQLVIYVYTWITLYIKL